MRIDWLNKLAYLLQTLAFCLMVATVQYAIQPERSYEMPVVYSLCIGTTIWALIDFGRHAFPSSAETGWPAGLPGWLLPLSGIVAGFLLGTALGDLWFGWSSWDVRARPQLSASITITAIAGVAGTYYFYSRNKALYLERKMSEARRHASEARLKLLETQLEPHMMFNTLANLRVLIGSDPVRAQQMLDRMISYLRATLGASRSSMHPLQAEFARLQDYLELMAVRMGPRLRYTLELPADLASVPVPALLLQPLVENSIQHGLEPKIEGGSILVRADRQAGDLIIEVTDTGVGGPSDVAPPDVATGGFGIAQVRERLAAAYGDAGRMTQHTPAGGGWATRLQLPLAATAA
ncbi:MAG: histidine kinase [Rhodoferax sp.]